MNFYKILEELDEENKGLAINPYANKDNGNWQEGYISIDWLNEHFGDLSNADDMIMRANDYSEATVLYFKWLKEQGILD